MARGTAEQTQATVGAGNDKAGRRRKNIVLLAALLAALAGVIALGTALLLDAQKGAAAPALPPLVGVAAAAQPRFLFSINGVSRSLGVAVSPGGDRIYATESDGERQTKVFDRDGKPVGVLNPPDTAPDGRVPVYVAAGPDGRVFVADRSAGAVHIYSPEGAYQGRLSAPDGNGWSPLALGFAPDGRLLVTDVTPGKHGVKIFGADGALIQHFGTEGSGDGQFSYPNGITADRSGRIIVADSNNGRVVVFDPEGRQLSAIGRGEGGGGLSLPRGVAVDDQSRLYVADTMGHDIKVFELSDKGARLLFSIGSEGIKDGQFEFPNGVALDASGRIYITDRENNRVQVWTY